MNIARENREGQTALIKVTVGKADFSDAVDRKLKEYRRKANIPGFRPGMVPMGIINKMYRKGTMAETAYKTATDAAFEYLKEEKIEHMGNVMPSDEQGTLDFDNGTEFEFIFEVGLAPEINFELSEKDELTRYKITADDEMRRGFRTDFMRRYGRLVDVEEVTGDEAVTGTLDNGNIHRDEAYVGLISMSDEERQPFMGKKVGDELVVNVEELFKTPSQRAAVLGVKKGELEGIDPQFRFTINKIRRFTEPELNEEFFATAFPEGNVKDAVQLEKYIDDRLEAELDNESGQVFNVELRNYLFDKANLSLPEEFLHRWLATVNEGKLTVEEIDKEFPAILNHMRWDLIQKYLTSKLDVKVEQEDMMAEAKAYAAQQFAQYGMANVGDEVLTNYASSIVADEEKAHMILDRLFERKITEAAMPLMTITTKNVTLEELNKIYNHE